MQRRPSSSTTAGMMAISGSCLLPAPSPTRSSKPKHASARPHETPSIRHRRVMNSTRGETDMARNLSVFGSDNGLGRGVAANPFLMLHREMNRLFDDVFRSTPVPFDQSGEAIVPQINVSQTEKELRVTAELPGVSEKDIDLTVDCDVLTIRAEKKVERKEEKEKENYYFVERAYGTFQRSLRLPFSVDAGQVQAQFENGVLTVTLPKPQGQQQSRKIEVQKAKESAQSGESANTQGGKQAAST